MDSVGLHRPRNLDWRRAAALLYGDWGTSKAYVIGLAFVAASYSALPIILAVCALTALVGYNYIIVCRHFPDGGGVYSAARSQSRLLAVMGALLLVANFTVTAAMSGWAAMHYFGVPREQVRMVTIGLILVIGVVNYFGPKHSGNLAVSLAVPMAIGVLGIIVLSLPHLSMDHLKPSPMSPGSQWVAFTGIILALSGVEAIANLTGVMKLDPGASMEKPKVARTARRAIVPVAVEVVLGTTLLGWAMLSLPEHLAPMLKDRWEDMLRFMAEQYGTMAFGVLPGHVFGLGMGIVVGLLLLSAVNTAVAALIGLVYMMARDGEMPGAFARLNSHGVPRWPLLIAVLMPVGVALFSTDLESLAGLYAIGVVGAITVNLGSCSFNLSLKLGWWNRALMGLTFLVLLAVELTIARTQPDALFFAVCVLGLGLGLRAYSQKRAGLRTLTLKQEIAAAVAPESLRNFQPSLQPGKNIMVAARGMNPVLRFAMEEARLRQCALYVLYVKELAVTLSGPIAETEAPRWQDDPEAGKIMCGMLALGKEHNVPVIPAYATSDNPAGTILDLSALFAIEILILGASHRGSLTKLLKGSVLTEVAHNLPATTQLIIHG